jgi:hypothetical protein
VCRNFRDALEHASALEKYISLEECEPPQWQPNIGLFISKFVVFFEMFVISIFITLTATPAAGRTCHTILRPPTSTWAKMSLTATLTFRTHLHVYQIPLVSSLVLCALTDLVIPGWSVNVF